MTNKFGEQIYQASRIEAFRNNILGGNLDSRATASWNNVTALPATYTLAGPLDPWDFPRYYIDPEDSDAKTKMVTDDSQAAFRYALRYKVLGGQSDAAQAVKILTAYAQISTYVDKFDGPLVWAQVWPILLQAAYLVKDSAAYTPAVHNLLVSGTLKGSRDLEEIAYTRTNNWAAVGIACEIALAGFVQDRPRFDRALRQYRHQFSHQIRSGITLQGQVRNNIPIEEIYRDGVNHNGNGSSGLAYSNMTLWGFAAAAEFARLNGEWLFDFVATDGSTLKGLYENVALWTAYPTQENLWFNTSATTDPPGKGYGYGVARPWVDVLGQLWANSNANVVKASLNPAASARSIMGYEFIYRSLPLWG